MDPEEEESKTEPQTTPPGETPTTEEGKEGWRAEFELVNRWKACVEKNSRLAHELLKQNTGFDDFKQVPLDSKLDVLAAIEPEVLG